MISALDVRRVKKGLPLPIRTVSEVLALAAANQPFLASGRTAYLGRSTAGGPDTVLYAALDPDGHIEAARRLDQMGMAAEPGRLLIEDLRGELTDPAWWRQGPRVRRPGGVGVHARQHPRRAPPGRRREQRR